MVTANLPQQPTSFIGRSDEIADITNRLDDPNCRLLTLVGPGGIGKTRLAIEVSSHLPRAFPDGVYFVALQPVASVENVVPTVASAIGFEFFESSNPALQLLSYLQDKRLLLILDNYEQLLPATAVVTELLNGAPQSKLLITSREALNLRDEWVFHVTAMSYPEEESVDAIDAYSAVKLFVERAQRMRRDFLLAKEIANVVRVCQLVDGMPLGIELAATWLRRLPCSEIAREIQRGLNILETDMQGIPDRHRSMRAVFDHSWVLLDEEERRVLKGLSVFRGGFRREAAEQVAGTSLHTLSALVDKSMLKVNSDGRYTIHELQRQYAEEWFDETPETKTACRDRHCAYYAEFMCRPTLDFVSEDSRATLQEIDAEVDNVRAAWHWAVERKRVNDLDKAMHSLYRYTWMRNLHREGEQCFGEAVAALRDVEPTHENEVVLGKALSFQGITTINSRQARGERLRESVAILRRLDARPELGRAIGYLGGTFVAESDWENARPLLEESVALTEETDEVQFRCHLYNLMGWMNSQLGHFTESEDYYQQALVLGRKIGDYSTIADAQIHLGDLAYTRGEYVKARRLLEQGLAVTRKHELVGDAIGARYQLGRLTVATGELETAKRYLEEGMAIAKEHNVKPWRIALTLIDLARVLIAEGDYETARAHLHEACQIEPNHLAPVAQAELGHIALRSGDYVKAWQCYTENQAYYRQINHGFGIAVILAAMGKLAVAQGNHAQARRHFLESLQAAMTIGALPTVLDAMLGVAELFMRQGDFTQAVCLAVLIANHPASHAETREQAENLLTHLEAELSVPDFEADVEQAMNLELETVATQLVEQLAAQIEQPLVEPLSERELEVLRLVAAGKSNPQIARELTVALSTVKSHLHNINQKLAAGNRTEAVARARNLRLI